MDVQNAFVVGKRATAASPGVDNTRNLISVHKPRKLFSESGNSQFPPPPKGQARDDIDHLQQLSNKGFSSIKVRHSKKPINLGIKITHQIYSIKKQS